MKNLLRPLTQKRPWMHRKGCRKKAAAANLLHGNYQLDPCYGLDAMGYDESKHPQQHTSFVHISSYFFIKRCSVSKKTGPTVDGQNPAPPRMMIIPLFIGF